MTAKSAFMTPLALTSHFQNKPNSACLFVCIGIVKTALAFRDLQGIVGPSLTLQGQRAHYQVSARVILPVLGLV